MKITKNAQGNKLTVTLEGRLDTTTAPELEKELILDEIEELIFDFTALRYVSSAGLRVLLTAQKKMNQQQGKMVIKNVNGMIMEIFDMTGFSDILNIEN